jgi:hypothetical protein
MKYTRIKSAGRFCALLLSAALSPQPAGAEPAAPAPDTGPKPDVEKTARQLEEVMKLLKQGDQADGGGTATDSPKGPAESAQKTPKKPATKH